MRIMSALGVIDRTIIMIGVSLLMSACVENRSLPPHVTEQEKQNAMQDIRSCLRENLPKLDDRISDAASVGRALQSACHKEFANFLEPQRAEFMSQFTVPTSQAWGENKFNELDIKFKRDLTVAIVLQERAKIENAKTCIDQAGHAAAAAAYADPTSVDRLVRQFENYTKTVCLGMPRSHGFKEAPR